MIPLAFAFLSARAAVFPAHAGLIPRVTYRVYTDSVLGVFPAHAGLILEYAHGCRDRSRVFPAHAGLIPHGE